MQFEKLRRGRWHLSPAVPLARFPREAQDLLHHTSPYGTHTVHPIGPTILWSGSKGWDILPIGPSTLRPRPLPVAQTVSACPPLLLRPAEFDQTRPFLALPHPGSPSPKESVQGFPSILNNLRSADCVVIDAVQSTMTAKPRTLTWNLSKADPKQHSAMLICPCSVLDRHYCHRPQPDSYRALQYSKKPHFSSFDSYRAPV